MNQQLPQIISLICEKSERAEETPASTPENKPQLDSVSRDLLKSCSNNWSEERTWAVGISIDNRFYWCFLSTSDHVYGRQHPTKPATPKKLKCNYRKALRHGYSQSQTWQSFIIEGTHAAKNNLELQDFHYWNCAGRIRSDHVLNACWTI